MSATNAARRRVQQLRRIKSRRSGREAPIPLRLMICGAVFVLLVAAKLLFPDAVDRLADSARQVIGRDADFKEAFAAVGRAVSGERPVSDSLQEAYAAVFDLAPPETVPDPAPQPEAEQDLVPQPADAGEPSAAPDAARLRSGVLPLPEVDQAVMRELVISPEGTAPMSLPAGDGPRSAEEESGDGSEEVPEEAVAAMSQVYTMAPMPENASLEQRNLGFEHCTPVPGRLSSAFGWREHPIEGGSRFHYGVDLAAAEGTDILAFADGEVYASGESSTLGNYIMLRHEGGYVTLYAHCSRVTASGGSVAMGDKIAEVGATGLATGPHLHFELHDGELYLNPIYYVAVE